jgi:hypothetical protein
MARTVKREWTRPDGWHTSCRLARQARPAGRYHQDLDDALGELEDLDADTDYRRAGAR